MVLPASDSAAWLEQAIAIARRAGRLILRYYQGEITALDKPDGTPVTEADRAADALIVPALAALTPAIPVVAEESVEAEGPPDIAGGHFWLVDPLDGTREFIGRNGDFTVNIALVDPDGPVLGVVHTPADGRLWAGRRGGGAFEEDAEGRRVPISVRRPDPAALVVVASRSHANPQLADYLAGLPVARTVSRGSALKFCLLARGEADLYPRTGPTMEWDTAAGHAVLLAAGGRMTRFEGGPFGYGKPGFRNGWFLARGG